MKLYAEVTSDRASKGQGGNKYIIVDFTVGNVSRENIGQVELYYSDDTKHGVELDEWILQYRPSEEEDWIIIAQGNVERKGKKRKGAN